MIRAILARAAFPMEEGSDREKSVGDDEQFVFRLGPTIPGTYRVRPALAFAMYEPGRRAWSSSFLLKVLPR